MKRSLSILLMLTVIGALLGQAALADAAVPSLQIRRRPVPENDAMEFLKDLGVGWNLGNTFDAEKGGWNANADEMTLETAWCGAKTTPEIFDTLRAAGFSTVRIPVSWHDHVTGDDCRISERWLARVQEVVGWALERGFYVILNIHHDERQFLPSAEHAEEAARYIEAIWTQLAERFREYDDHLIFESMNEPRLVGHGNEWYYDPNVPDCVQAAECINRLNQIFVDTVRASGGHNADRYLMVPGYDAAPGGVLNDVFVLPRDTAENRIIVSAHAYTPYAFALQEGGKQDFDSAYPSDTQEIIGFMNALYDRYITQGIPVVIGEFGARDKGGNLQARVNFTAFYTAAASARNLPCLLWDNHAFKGNGELFGVLDRKTAAFAYPEIIEAMMAYGGYRALSDPE